MLTGYLSLICTTVAVIYAVLDLSHQVYYSLFSYVILFVMPLVSIMMIRAGHFKWAKVSLMLSVNLVVFWSALNDPFET